MTELAKIIFDQIGCLVLDKEQTSKLIGKKVSYINDAIFYKKTNRIPKWSQKVKNGNIEFDVQDVADFLEQRRKQTL